VSAKADARGIDHRQVHPALQAGFGVAQQAGQKKSRFTEEQITYTPATVSA